MAKATCAFRSARPRPRWMRPCAGCAHSRSRAHGGSSTERLKEVEAPKEKAVLVGVEFKGQETPWRLADSLTELALLADTAGVDVVGTLEQRIDRPNPATLIGS